MQPLAPEGETQGDTADGHAGVESDVEGLPDVQPLAAEGETQGDSLFEAIITDANGGTSSSTNRTKQHHQ